MRMKNVRQINYWTIGGFEGEKPIPQALAEARRMGFEGLEPTFGAGCLHARISQADCKAIRRQARELGMPIRTLATGNYWTQSLSDPRAAVRKRAVAFTKEYLQVAKWLGAKVVLVIPGAVAVPWDPSQPIVPYQTTWRHATASIRQCLSAARKLGVTMALENVWNWFLADPIARLQGAVDRGDCSGTAMVSSSSPFHGYCRSIIALVRAIATSRVPLQDEAAHDQKAGNRT